MRVVPLSPSCSKYLTVTQTFYFEMSDVYPLVKIQNYNGKVYGNEGEKEEERAEGDAEEKNEIEKLPNELLLYVFSFLSVYEVKTAVAYVCKRWWQLSGHTSLLDDLHFGPFLDLDEITRVLREATNLKKLRLFGRHDTNDILRIVATTNQRLSVLKVSTKPEWRHVQVDGLVLLDFLKAVKGLRYLTLKRVTLTETRAVFYELGTHAPNLRGLNLNHSCQLDTHRLHRLVASLPKLIDFRIYGLSYNQIGSQTPYTDPPVVELLTKMSDTLRTLKLNMMGLTGEVMAYLAAASDIQVLHLYRATGLENESLLHILRLEKLEELLITVPRAITADCFVRLFGEPSMSGLRVVSVANSYSLDDMALSALAANCPGLEELAVPGCRRVTDAGLLPLARSCSRLKRLNLFSTRSLVSNVFPLFPELLPSLQLLIYKPVDKQLFEFPDELFLIPSLIVTSSYKYK